MKELWETNEGIKLSRGVFQRGGGEFYYCVLYKKKKLCCREVGDKIVLLGEGTTYVFL